MVDGVGLRALQGGGRGQGVLQAPASALHQLPPRAAAVGPRHVPVAALADHRRGVPPRDVRREVGKGQPHEATAGGAPPRARRVATGVIPAQPVHEPGPCALHRILAAPGAAEDLAEGLQPEWVLLGTRHDRVADEPLRALFQEDGVDEVLLPQQHARPDALGGVQEAVQGPRGLDVDVRIHSTDDVEDRKAGNVCTLDA
mmetsp:Transcript_38438/g.119953  ORF Transcript_38438/g.119953 Transcript_38438/m.119953 type:complete len:200 (+) Transcript_38438:358-957(+)